MKFSLIACSVILKKKNCMFSQEGQRRNKTQIKSVWGSSFGKPNMSGVARKIYERE